jgi:conjugative transfer signal peptidase TraF
MSLSKFQSTYLKTLGVGGLFLSLLGVTSSLLGHAGYFWNDTSSLPVGLWHLDSQQPQRGDIVLICPTQTPFFEIAKQRGYLKPGSCPGGTVPLLKPIVAVPGDRITVGHNEIRVNGNAIKNSVISPADTKGRAVSHPPLGTQTVPTKSVWVISSYSDRSFDSRYFGALPIQNIKGKATLVLRWPESKPL